jgi:hypothetical protein
MDRWNPQGLEVLKVKNWKELSRNRKEWNKLVEKAKTDPGLYCCRRRRRRRRRRRSRRRRRRRRRRRTYHGGL